MGIPFVPVITAAVLSLAYGAYVHTLGRPMFIFLLLLARRLELHFTPKHGSWLNMAETEIGILTGQCLDRRIDQSAVVSHETAAWEKDRNDAKATINWRFTIADARVKLKNIYPSIEI